MVRRILRPSSRKEEAYELHKVDREFEVGNTGGMARRAASGISLAWR